MTEDVRRRRELSISDYCFMIHAESLLTDHSGYRYLVYTPNSRSVRALGRVRDESVSEVTRCVLACALAVVVCGTFGAAIWFAYFAPILALPAAPQLSTRSLERGVTFDTTPP